jgi:hypothetical protein
VAVVAWMAIASPPCWVVPTTLGGKVRPHIGRVGLTAAS